MRIALGVSYDGSSYCGWQSQEAVPTIQTTLQDALSKVADHPVKLVCAGRTDRGVHAVGQVAHFDTEAVRTEHAWILGVNTYLPADIRVHWFKVVPDDFHARFSAQARSYRYVILNRKVHSALLRNQATWYHQPLDEHLMQIGANYLLGEHDFSSFRAMECQAKSPVRTLHRLEVYRTKQFVFIDIKANAFLHHMVRNIAGVLMLIGSQKKPPQWAQEVLLARDRTQAGITASPNGLCFLSVIYPQHFDIPMDDDSAMHAVLVQ